MRSIALAIAAAAFVWSGVYLIIHDWQWTGFGAICFAVFFVFQIDDDDDDD